MTEDRERRALVEQLVEDGCRAVYGRHWDGPPEKMPGDEMKVVWRRLVEKAQAPVLPALRSDPSGYREGIEAAAKDASPLGVSDEASDRRVPAIEFHQHDFLAGFAAFKPGATQVNPESKAFCVVNVGSFLGAVEQGAVIRTELPYFIAESMMHEVMHALEQWAGVEFSEERVDALLERYRAQAALLPASEKETGR